MLFYKFGESEKDFTVRYEVHRRKRWITGNETAIAMYDALRKIEPTDPLTSGVGFRAMDA
jgi:hypothetical protein